MRIFSSREAKIHFSKNTFQQKLKKEINFPLLENFIMEIPRNLQETLELYLVSETRISISKHCFENISMISPLCREVGMRKYFLKYESYGLNLESVILGCRIFDVLILINSTRNLMGGRNFNVMCFLCQYIAACIHCPETNFFRFYRNVLRDVHIQEIRETLARIYFYLNGEFLDVTAAYYYGIFSKLNALGYVTFEDFKDKIDTGFCQVYSLCYRDLFFSSLKPSLQFAVVCYILGRWNENISSLLGLDTSFVKKVVDKVSKKQQDFGSGYFTKENQTKFDDSEIKMQILHNQKLVNRMTFYKKENFYEDNKILKGNMSEMGIVLSKDKKTGEEASLFVYPFNKFGESQIPVDQGFRNLLWLGIFFSKKIRFPGIIPLTSMWFLSEENSIVFQVEDIVSDALFTSENLDKNVKDIFCGVKKLHEFGLRLAPFYETNAFVNVANSGFVMFAFGDTFLPLFDYAYKKSREISYYRDTHANFRIQNNLKAISGNISQETDIYSLGIYILNCLCFNLSERMSSTIVRQRIEMLKSGATFEEKAFSSNDDEVVEKIKEEALGKLPEKIQSLLRGMLDPNPGTRYTIQQCIDHKLDDFGPH